MEEHKDEARWVASQGEEEEFQSCVSRRKTAVAEVKRESAAPRRSPEPSRNLFAALPEEAAAEETWQPPPSRGGGGGTGGGGKAARQRKVSATKAGKKQQREAPARAEKDGASRIAAWVSILVALAIWVPPTVSWMFEPPHELSRRSRVVVDRHDGSLVFLRPRPDSVVDSSTIVCELAGHLLRAGGIVQVDVFLDERRILSEKGHLRAPAGVPNDTDGKQRLQLDMGHLAMGMHNLTITLASLEYPPRFPAIRNTSLFVSSRLVHPDDRR